MSDLDGLVGGEEVEDGFFDRGLEDAGEGGGVGVELGGVALGLLLQIAVYVVGLEIEDDDAVRLRQKQSTTPCSMTCSPAASGL